MIDELKTEAKQNPLAALAVGALIATTAVKFLNAATANRNSRTWSKEVKRRVKQGK